MKLYEYSSEALRKNDLIEIDSTRTALDLLITTLNIGQRVLNKQSH